MRTLGSYDYVIAGAGSAGCLLANRDKIDLLRRLDRFEDLGLTVDGGRGEDAPDVGRRQSLQHFRDDHGVQDFAELLQADVVPLGQHQFQIRLKQGIVDQCAR